LFFFFFWFFFFVVGGGGGGGGGGGLSAWAYPTFQASDVVHIAAAQAALVHARVTVFTLDARGLGCVRDHLVVKNGVHEETVEPFIVNAVAGFLYRQ